MKMAPAALLRKAEAEPGLDALRHTFATHHVRQALGHGSLATPGVYVGLAREAMDQELQRNAL